MSYFNWDYLGLDCQYPVSNIGTLTLEPEPGVDCGKPAVAIARWYEDEDAEGPGGTMLLCQKHLNMVLKAEKEQRKSGEGASTPS